jgi:hypothetical protein
MASVELYDGMNPEVVGFDVHATPNSFKAGDLVTIDATGGVLLATAAVTFLGIARTDTSGVGGTGKIPVELINPNSIYVIRWSTTGTVTATSTTQLGSGVGTTNAYGAHTWSDTLTSSAYIVGLDPRDGDTGAAGGRLLVRFYGTALTQPVST